MALFDPASRRLQWFGDARGLLADSPYALHIDHTGRLWAGTERGLFVSDPASGRFSRVLDLPAIRVWSLSEAPNGDLWAGTADGLFHLSGNHWERLTKTAGLVEDAILATAIAPSGDVWVGYQTSGTLTRIQPNGRDLRIRVTDRSAKCTAVSGDLRKGSRCVAFEGEDAAHKILGKHCFRSCQQPRPALALGDQLNSIKDFCLSDRGRKQFYCRLLRNPGNNPSRGLGSHKF